MASTTRKRTPSKKPKPASNQRLLSAFGFAKETSLTHPPPDSSTSLDLEQSKTPDSTASSSEPAIVKNFQSKWLHEFPWLYRETDGAMFCKICKDANKNSFAVGGSMNFQRSALVRHQECKDHIGADKASNLNLRPITNSLEPEITSYDALQCMLGAAKFIIEEELPDIKFKPLLSHMVSGNFGITSLQKIALRF